MQGCGPLGGPSSEMFQCSECPQTFRFKTGLDAHLKLTHDIQLPYSCGLCPGVYRYRKNLYMHQRKAHGLVGLR